MVENGVGPCGRTGTPHMDHRYPVQPVQQFEVLLLQLFPNTPLSATRGSKD